MFHSSDVTYALEREMGLGHDQPFKVITRMRADPGVGMEFQLNCLEFVSKQNLLTLSDLRQQGIHVVYDGHADLTVGPKGVIPYFEKTFDFEVADDRHKPLLNIDAGIIGRRQPVAIKVVLCGFSLRTQHHHGSRRRRGPIDHLQKANASHFVELNKIPLVVFGHQQRVEFIHRGVTPGYLEAGTFTARLREKSAGEVGSCRWDSAEKMDADHEASFFVWWEEFQRGSSVPAAVLLES
jgi:hypothetical protein